MSRPDFTARNATRFNRIESEPIRVAVIGLGNMGQHHIRAILRLAAEGVAALVAAADPSADARRALSDIAPNVHVFESLESLLSGCQVDVVHICTSLGTHEPLAELAIASGCHVYVEKPVAVSVSSAQHLLEQAAANRRQLCPGHQLVFEQPTRQLMALLPAVGRVVHVESYFAFRAMRHGSGSRVPQPEDLQLVDILPHPTSLLLHVLEKIAPAGRHEMRAVVPGHNGTVHALVSRGGVTGTLIVTIDGRPVESYLRVVGTNGVLHADFVRGTTRRLLGPGVSIVDKILNPYREARQLIARTSVALARRFSRGERSYPGLVEIFSAFYASIRRDGAPPISAEHVVNTTEVSQALARELGVYGSYGQAPARDPEVVVTGGTGLLGQRIVKTLVRHGIAVRVLARRAPAAWSRLPGVDYRAIDLATGLAERDLRGAHTIVHCAAETAGGWDDHQRNSIDATERLVRTAAAVGIRRVIHVSSLSVLPTSLGRRPIDEDSPMLSDARAAGAYAWGKLESERRLGSLAKEHNVEVRVLRPGALADFDAFDPPGLLGRRIGNIFVAVGSPSESLAVVDVEFAADIIRLIARYFDAAPRILHLVPPELPTKRELVDRLRSVNPDLTIVWIPRLLLRPLSWFAIAMQRMLRPGRPAIDVAKVFARQRIDTARIAEFCEATSAASVAVSASTPPIPAAVSA